MQTDQDGLYHTSAKTSVLTVQILRGSMLSKNMHKLKESQGTDVHRCGLNRFRSLGEGTTGLIIHRDSVMNAARKKRVDKKI